MGKHAPTPPDPVATANAQAGLNKETALYNAGLNRIDQNSPYGSTKYTYGGVDASGVPKYTQNTTLTALGQQNLDNQQKQDAQLSGLGFGLADQAKSSLAQPLGNSDDARKQAQDAYYAKATGYMNPRFANDTHDLETQLSNQGVQHGSEAWNRAKDEQGRTQNAAYDQAQQGAIGAGTDAQSKAQALALQLRTAPLNELNALRSGTQVVNPSVAAAGQASAGSPDYMGAVNNQYQSQLASYNNSQSGIAGLLGAGAGMFSPIHLSDRRLKVNIAHIGATPGGLPIYSYNYRGDDEPRIGVMAQDVLEVMPGAVTTLPCGYMAVDYAMIA